MECIDRFTGEYRFLSNFYHSTFYLDGYVYSTVEHYYQSMKTVNIHESFFIRAAPTPALAKRRGRVTDIRLDWEEVKVSVMYAGLKAKFRQHSDLCECLLATGHAQLIEGNYWHDNYWGRCVCPKCKDTWGKNILGSLLMTIRGDLM